jgi:predicted alpha/beta hydrolase
VAFDALTAPLLSIDLPDDDMAPPASADALRAAYSRAKLRHRVVAASELPPSARGHFGAFRPGAAPLWGEIDDFLREEP